MFKVVGVMAWWKKSPGDRRRDQGVTFGVTKKDKKKGGCQGKDNRIYTGIRGVLGESA